MIGIERRQNKIRIIWDKVGNMVNIKFDCD